MKFLTTVLIATLIALTPKNTYSSADRNFIDTLKAGQKGGYATDKQYASKLKLLGDQMKFEMSGGVSPTYLKCLGRENEIK